jgi:hypothetical protein
VSRGRLYRSGQNGYTQKSFDIVSAFLDVLGKSACQAPDNYERGEFLVDTSMDLETNATMGLARENSLMLKRGNVPADAVIKMAQTFRSGTNDIDAIDFVEMFLEDEEQTSLDDLNEKYVLVNFRPVVTKKNWRMDCGVAGYDNSFGLPPFFPPACDLKTTSTASGCSRMVSRRPMSTRRRTIPRATICAIRRRPRFSTRKYATCSNGKSRIP